MENDQEGYREEISGLISGVVSGKITANKSILSSVAYNLPSPEHPCLL